MPERIQRKRTKGWKMPPNTVYVGRPGPWGNPFRACLPIDAVRSYRRWLRGAPDLRNVGHPPVAEEIKCLAGKNLACWCAILDQQNNYTPCHADVLLSLANDVPIDEVIRENIRRAKGETL